MKFAQVLRRERLSRLMSQCEFAATLGIPPSTYVTWEQGKYLPSLGHMAQLLAFFPSFDETKRRIRGAYVKGKLG